MEDDSNVWLSMTDMSLRTGVKYGKIQSLVKKGKFIIQTSKLDERIKLINLKEVKEYFNLK